MRSKNPRGNQKRVFVAGTIVSLCVLAVLVVVGMAVAEGGGDEDGGRVKITVQMFEGPESAAMVPPARYWNTHYADTTGIEVETTALNRIGYFDKLEIGLISGRDTPDIVHPFSLHLGRIDRYLEPLDGYLADREVMTAPDGSPLSLDSLLPIALDAVRHPDGRTYMIPTDMSQFLLYYRKDLIADPPDTWADYEALARRFTRALNPDSPTRYGTIMQGKYEVWTFCAALQNIWSAGVDVFAPMTRDDRARLQESLRTFETLARDGALPPESAFAEYPQVAATIQRGEVAMAIQWNAFYPVLMDEDRSPKVHDRFDIAPPPGIRADDGTVTRANYMHTINLAINRTSAHKRAAARFLTWVTLGEGAAIYARAGGAPPVKSIWHNTERSDYYPRLLRWLNAFGRTTPAHPRLPEMMMVGSGWIQRIMVGNATAEQAAMGLHLDLQRARLAAEPVP